jgi:hypothetical protein
VVPLLSDGISGDWLQTSLTRKAGSPTFVFHSRTTFFGIQQQPKQQERGWMGRHPVLFGTMVGFGAGFLIGYVPGRDGTCPDFDASECGWIVGGVGAGAGAIAGFVAALAMK